MDTKIKILGLLGLTMIVLLTSFSWFININNSYISENENNVYLSDIEAQKIVNDFSPKKRYYWQEKKVILNKKTWIPLIYSKKTIKSDSKQLMEQLY